MLKTSRRPWRTWRCLNVLCTTLERPRQPFVFLSAFTRDLVSFVVAQGRHKGRRPCVKGVFICKKVVILSRPQCVACFQKSVASIGQMKDAVLITIVSKWPTIGHCFIILRTRRTISESGHGLVSSICQSIDLMYISYRSIWIAMIWIFLNRVTRYWTGSALLQRNAITWTIYDNWSRGWKLQWNMNQCTTVFCHENAFENVVHFCGYFVPVSWWRHQMETFPRYWLFVRGIPGHHWIPCTKASDAELWCFLWSAPE